MARIEVPATRRRGRRTQASQDGGSVQRMGSGTLALRLTLADRPLTAPGPDNVSHRLQVGPVPPAAMFMTTPGPQGSSWMGFSWSGAGGDRSSVQAHQWPCMAGGRLLSGVNDQDSPAGNGRDGADILVGPPVRRALLRPHHRAASWKSSATRRADDCTGRQRFGAPQAWEYGTSGRFRQRPGDRHVTSSTSLR